MARRAPAYTGRSHPQMGPEQDMRNPTDAVLDATPVNARQLAIVAVILLALVIDGLDIQLLALAAPLIFIDWGIDRASFGPAMSAALIGMSVGATLGGWLGDRFGRKSVLVVATFGFGAATVAASL